MFDRFSAFQTDMKANQKKSFNKDLSNMYRFCKKVNEFIVLDKKVQLHSGKI